MRKDGTKIFLEEKALFSQSMLWRLQREYYANMGPEAWCPGVPYYVTSNSAMGLAYAQTAMSLFATLADASRETVYILELGAGHARLSFYFLRHFSKLYKSCGRALPKFCYVISDFAEKNIHAALNHPQLKPFMEEGCADAGLFDMTGGDSIVLRNTGVTLSAGSLSQPLALIANYVFDSIPQDLFFIENREIYDCRVSIGIEEKDFQEGAPPSPEQLFLQYAYEKCETLSGMPEYARKILEYYKTAISGSHLLLPTGALEGMERLRRFSRQGMMVLTADKGDHNLRHEAAPMPVPHGRADGLRPGGCFSFSVNYHAVKKYCEFNNGFSLFPRAGYSSVNTGCLILADCTDAYRGVVSTYEQVIGRFGPDMIAHLTNSLLKSGVGAQEILYLLGLNQYDPQFFAWALPHIYSLAEISEEQRESFLSAAAEIWAMKYDMDETFDLAHSLGGLLFHLAYYEEALSYFSLSPRANHENVVQDMLFCLYKLKRHDQAIRLLENLRDRSLPDHPQR